MIFDDASQKFDQFLHTLSSEQGDDLADVCDLAEEMDQKYNDADYIASSW